MQFGMRFRREDAADKVNDRYWHAIEGTPIDEVRRIQEERLRDQMAYLKANSTFYQEKFAEAGVEFGDIRTIEDLQKLPYTYKTEIRESLAAEPPFGKHRAAPMADIIQMQASSGTTGSPSYIALTEADAEMWHEMTARCFFANGVRPGDMVLHAFSLAKGFVGGIPVVQGLQYMGAIDVPVGADGGVERLLRACADTRPRCIVGAPNFVLHLAEKAPEVLGCKASELGVERVIVGGEPGGGIPALLECLNHRLYARLNLQQAIEVSDSRAVFRMVDCRVQSARKRKGLDDFPCKSVGIVEYSEFARTIDPRIQTRCIACPPDAHPEEFWCAWEFTLQD